MRQRLAVTAIDLPNEARPFDEEHGYLLQGAANGILEVSLGTVAGHKIGCTTAVMQAFLGIHSPCAGEVFASTVLRGDASVSRSAYRRLGIECEIVVELARDAGGGAFTRETAAELVGAVMAGIEIVDDRYRDYRTQGVPTLIADNFFNAGCVLGEPVKNWREFDLAALEGRTLINGEEVGRGLGSAVLGHPLEALAWLANKRGPRLKRGQFVFLGSLVETKWLNAGDVARIEISSLGALELTVTA